MWNAELKPCWRSMRVNVSKFSTVLSDFPWPREAPLFPNQASVHAYLNEYARTRIPPGVIQFGVRVVRVERNPADGPAWMLVTKPVAEADSATAAPTSRLFDYVIVASGFFAEPSPLVGLELPDIRTNQPAGDGIIRGILHSSQYRGSWQIANRRVVVVGGSLSAAEIAADAALTASQTVHIAPHGFWALPRLIVAQADPNCAAPDFVPLDVAFYKAVQRESTGEVKLRSPEDWARVAAYFKSICGGRRQLCCGPDDPPSGKPLWITISDLYHQLLEAGKIRLLFGRVVSLTADRLKLLPLNPSDSQEDLLDIGPDEAVIVCSGYRPRLDFLAPEILAELTGADDVDVAQGSPQLGDTFCPLLLHQCMLHPRLPGLAFVGMYRGPFWSVIELQARRVAAIFSGSQPAPSLAELEAGLASERLVRDQRPRPQFPHPDLVGMCNDLFGCQPVSSGHLLANAYRLGGPHPAVADELADLCADPDGASAAAAIARALHSTRWRLEGAAGDIAALEFVGSPHDDPGRRLTLQCREDPAGLTLFQLVFEELATRCLAVIEKPGSSPSRLRLSRSADGWLAESCHGWRFCFAFCGIRLAKLSMLRPTGDSGGCLAEYLPAD